MEGVDHIAAFTDRNGDLINVEKGGGPPSDFDLEIAERIIVHYVDINGNDVYFTVLGGLAPEYDVYDAIEDKISSDSDKYAPMYPGQ